MIHYGLKNKKILLLFKIELSFLNNKIKENVEVVQ
jgi:hypothetical protein